MHHFWNTIILNFDLENLRSMSWLWSKVKVIKRVQYQYWFISFFSMPIGQPIPEIQLFKHLTLKIQGQGHGWDKKNSENPEYWDQWSSHITGKKSYWFIFFLFHANRDNSSLRYSYFKILHWKSKVKVGGRIKIMVKILNSKRNLSITSYPEDSRDNGLVLSRQQAIIWTNDG